MRSRSRGIFCCPEESEKAGRAPADFVRFIRDRVCETQKELLRLMGESIQLDEEIKVNSDEGINEGINQLLSVQTRSDLLLIDAVSNDVVEFIEIPSK